MDKKEILSRFNLTEDIVNSVSTGRQWMKPNGEKVTITSPIDGSKLAGLPFCDENTYEKVLEKATAAFPVWRKTPAPARGAVIREYGNMLRRYKNDLGALVTLEMGKSLQEGKGEVQEMIDICDFAVGLSRQLHGVTMHSERPSHRMYEQYHPLGPVGIITAFNFPVAVWSWNAMIAAVCGDVCIWKPSEKTPLTAMACQHLLQSVLEAHNVPEGVFCVMPAGRDIGEKMAKDHRLPLISATGSVAMGKKVGATVLSRLGKPLLELGGNNAMIITDKADLDLALRAAVFGAVGTAGQRCTTTRRLIIHPAIYDDVKDRLVKVYKQLTIGDPLNTKNIIGPLIDEDAVSAYFRAIENVEKENGNVIYGGNRVYPDGMDNGCYVEPVLVEAKDHFEAVQTETFAPILYLLKYDGTISDAIRIQNNVPQGLSSSIFTKDLTEAETYLSHWGSDCGIANVNIGTSGAEIGGAFGGEKETGGGRESGSDAWKVYMRRQTNTINFGNDMPLAQGIEFNF